MSTAEDRRAPNAARIPFDAMVEVGGQLGPSFEAQAVNLSEEGMQLRTAYLPEVGQPVTCRFDAGGASVMAAGEVLWKEDRGDGGEFGIRFLNMDSHSIVSLQRILGMAEEGQLPAAPMAGRKVRLHIDGLASPMRARVKNDTGAIVTAYSELGFLQIDKPLDVEDAMNGVRRPAIIDRVEVEVEHETRVPHLVVTLRYDDEEARMMAAAAPVDIPMPDDTTGRDGSMEPHVMEQRMRDEQTGHAEPMPSDPAPATEPDEESKRLKGAFAHNAAKVTPALQVFAKRAKEAIAQMAARAKKKAGEVEIPIRRTTAPPPGGALHAAGRKVVRGEIAAEKEFDAPPAPRFKMTKKKVAIAAAVSATLLLALVATRKPSPQAPTAANAPPPADSAAHAAAPGAMTMPPATITPKPDDPLLGAANGSGGLDENGKAQPFSNGSVGSHGNVLKLKMDGAIGRIQGASQPTGFTVVIPGRKSLDSAGPLAAKDNRIAAIRVANEPAGAELTVTFKDGVPNYQVRAKGDTLEMVLAKPSGPAEKSADAKPSHGKRHKKH